MTEHQPTPNFTDGHLSLERSDVENRHQRLRQMVAEGVRDAEIAAVLGMARNTVRLFVFKNGLPSEAERTGGLRIIRDAYGHGGFEAAVIEGIGLCVHRYGDLLVEETMIHALSSAAGGLNGLLTAAEKMRCSIGQPKPQCIAATAVGIYNRSHPTPKKKLASWWKE